MREQPEQSSLFRAAEAPEVRAVSPLERAARWALWTIEGIGHRRLERLIAVTDGRCHALFEDPLYAATVSAKAELPAHVLSSLSTLLPQDPGSLLDGELDRLGDDGALLMLGDPGYPPGLLDLEDPPYFISVRGDGDVLFLPRRLAMVGSREVPATHELYATRLASELAASGCVIVSGGALGMDAAAHRGALAAQGLTVVILPGGFGHLSPSRHRALFEQVVERGGVLLTEYPHEVAPRRYHFPRRNRLIAATCLACVVLRARGGSGTMLTVDACKSLGRPLSALPYDASDQGARGSLELIQRGVATLVVDASDVAEHAFGDVPPVVESPLETASGDGEDPVLALLSDAPRGTMDVDAICTKLGERTSAVLEHLMELELDGKIWRVPGAPAYRLAP